MSITATPLYWTILEPGGDVVGPLTRQNLLALLAQGRLTPSSPICLAGERSWSQLSAVLPPSRSLPQLPASSVVPPPIMPSGTPTGIVSPAPMVAVIPFAIGMLATAILTLVASHWLHSGADSAAKGSAQAGTHFVATAPPSVSEHAADARDMESIDLRRELNMLREELYSRNEPATAEPTESDYLAGSRTNLASVDGTPVTATPTSFTTESIGRGNSSVLPSRFETMEVDPSQVPVAEVFVPGLRRWQDSTGQYSTEAKLDSADPFFVSLVKPGGTKIEVPRSRLCLEDAVYVERAERLAPDIIRATEFVSTAPLPGRGDDAMRQRPGTGSPSTCISRVRKAEDLNRELFTQYQQRRSERRVYALDRRRQINANRGPHVYRTAISMPVNPLGYNAIQAGWVSQPPIPRPYYGYRYGYGARRSYSQSCAPRRHYLANY